MDVSFNALILEAKTWDEYLVEVCFGAAQGLKRGRFCSAVRNRGGANRSLLFGCCMTRDEMVPEVVSKLFPQVVRTCDAVASQRSGRQQHVLRRPIADAVPSRCFGNPDNICIPGISLTKVQQ